MVLSRGASTIGAVRNILVTGAAGFIGAHVAAALSQAGHRVVGCDNFNDYYDPALKRARVRQLLRPAEVPCERLDLTDAAATARLVQRGRFDTVLHLAAQAGVRHSVNQPLAYVQANLVGFGSVLEACRQAGVGHLLYASSSSVYGSRSDAPFRESDRTDQPASFYAATKQANELMAHATAAVHGLPCTGLRFFTVYGPWGRPDMAYWSFAQAMRRQQRIRLFGQGELLRDFTYVDDVVQALLRLVALGPAGAAGVPASVINVGHSTPVRVLDFVQALEAALGVAARIEFAPLQVGDVPSTCADSRSLLERIGPWQATPLQTGLGTFTRWLQQWDPLPKQGRTRPAWWRRLAPV